MYWWKICCFSFGNIFVYITGIGGWSMLKCCTQTDQPEGSSADTVQVRYSSLMQTESCQKELGERKYLRKVEELHLGKENWIKRKGDYIYLYVVYLCRIREKVITFIDIFFCAHKHSLILKCTNSPDHEGMSSFELLNVCCKYTHS